MTLVKSEWQKTLDELVDRRAQGHNRFHLTSGQQTMLKTHWSEAKAYCFEQYELEIILRGMVLFIARKEPTR